MSKKIVNTECRKVTWIRESNNHPDTHIMSMLDTFDDGTDRRYLKRVENYERSFYVTRKPHRKHKQKRIFEDLSNVQQFKCTQSRLASTVPRKLPFGSGRDFYHARNSPYLYGTDQHSEFLLKEEYSLANKSKIGSFNYAALDTESDVLDKYDGGVIIESVATGDDIYLTVLKDFLKGVDNPLKTLKDCASKYLSKEIQDGLKIEFHIHDKEIDVISKPISKLHEWKPDLVGVWNISHDIPLILKRLERHSVAPESIFSDPSVPKELRRFHFELGRDKSISKSGVVTSLSPDRRWHVTTSTSMFDWIDSMCSFSEIRSQEAKRPSFGLDAILKEFLDRGKLKFDHIEKAINGLTREQREDKEIKDLIVTLEQYRGLLLAKGNLNYAIEHTVGGLAWHEIMQRDYPVEYCIYNIFDTYGMILLERIIKDMTLKIPIFMGSTPILDLPRRAKRLSDMFHIYCMKNNKVPGSHYTNYPEENVLDLSGWIITAEASRLTDGGVKCLTYNTEVVTNIYCNLMDVDLVSSYPRIFLATGASRNTTKTEIISIGRGVTEQTKLHMINTLHGRVNAMDVSAGLFAMPTAQSVLAEVGSYLETG